MSEAIRNNGEGENQLGLAPHEPAGLSLVQNSSPEGEAEQSNLIAGRFKEVFEKPYLYREVPGDTDSKVIREVKHLYGIDPETGKEVHLSYHKIAQLYGHRAEPITAAESRAAKENRQRAARPYDQAQETEEPLSANELIKAIKAQITTAQKANADQDERTRMAATRKALNFTKQLAQMEGWSKETQDKNFGDLAVAVYPADPSNAPVEATVKTGSNPAEVTRTAEAAARAAWTSMEEAIGANPDNLSFHELFNLIRDAKEITLEAINSNTSLSDEQKAAALDKLETEARAVINKLMGGDDRIFPRRPDQPEAGSDSKPQPSTEEMQDRIKQAIRLANKYSIKKLFKKVTAGAADVARAQLSGDKEAEARAEKAMLLYFTAHGYKEGWIKDQAKTAGYLLAIRQAIASNRLPNGEDLIPKPSFLVRAKQALKSRRESQSTDADTLTVSTEADRRQNPGQGRENNNHSERYKRLRRITAVGVVAVMSAGIFSALTYKEPVNANGNRPVPGGEATPGSEEAEREHGADQEGTDSSPESNNSEVITVKQGDTVWKLVHDALIRQNRNHGNQETHPG
jgi:hypothetical protein